MPPTAMMEWHGYEAIIICADSSKPKTDALHTLSLSLSQLLPTHNAGVRARFHEVLAAENMALSERVAVHAVQEGPVVVMEDGRCLPADEVVWCTDAGAAQWVAESGLAADSKGFMLLQDTLESCSHAGVFGCGDIAHVKNHPRPKAGVFAVRQGPPLLANLKRCLLGQPLRPFVPQKDFMGLISTGDKCAVLSRGTWALGGHSWLGRQLWVWKDQIDRKWMHMYSADAIPDMAAAAPAPSAVAVVAGGAALDAIAHVAMRCGGCGAKVGASVLSRVMARLQVPSRAEVLVGLDSPDDAAIVEPPPAGYVGVHTVDYFRSFVADPFVFGQVRSLTLSIPHHQPREGWDDLKML